MYHSTQMQPFPVLLNRWGNIDAKIEMQALPQFVFGLLSKYRTTADWLHFVSPFHAVQNLLAIQTNEANDWVMGSRLQPLYHIAAWLSSISNKSKTVSVILDPLIRHWGDDRFNDVKVTWRTCQHWKKHTQSSSCSTSCRLSRRHRRSGGTQLSCVGGNGDVVQRQVWQAVCNQWMGWDYVLYSSLTVSLILFYSHSLVQMRWMTLFDVMKGAQ